MPRFGYSQFSLQNQGSDDTIDSDVNAIGSSADYTLLAGGLKDHLDAGLVPSL